jgi:hypothetical protein
MHKMVNGKTLWNKKHLNIANLGSWQTGIDLFKGINYLAIGELDRLMEDRS